MNPSSQARVPGDDPECVYVLVFNDVYQLPGISHPRRDCSSHSRGLRLAGLRRERKLSTPDRTALAHPRLARVPNTYNTTLLHCESRRVMSDVGLGSSQPKLEGARTATIL